METVTENKVLTQEELQTLKTIQEETQAIVIEFGEIELFQIQLNNRKENAKKFLEDLSKKEQDFHQSIFEKYGKITINPQTGEVTPIL